MGAGGVFSCLNESEKVSVEATVLFCFRGILSCLCMMPFGSMGKINWIDFKD